MAINYKDENGVIHSLIPDMNNIDDAAASASTTYSSSKVDSLLNNKQNAEAGKGLSSNDFTDDDKTAILNSPIPSTSTTSPLTDSADGMVQGITIYGRSEVVDGAIKSAGEGWSTVDLGTLNWGKETTATNVIRFNTPGISTSIKKIPPSEIIKCLIPKFTPASENQGYVGLVNDAFTVNTNGTISLYKPTEYADYTPETFKSAMSGVLLCYPLADPTQGNAIAVKTDDGTGIDGTMATFSTGTPLRGIPDTTVRDIMMWDGSVGTVTKNCGKLRLADLTWLSGYGGYYTNNTIGAQLAPTTADVVNAICSKYTTTSYSQSTNKTICGWTGGNCFLIKDDDYTTISDFLASLGDAELVYELATPVTTPLTDAEISAFRGLKTYDSTTNITITNSPEFEIDYLKNTDNGQAVSNIQKDLQGQIDGITSQVNKILSEAEIQAQINDRIYQGTDLTVKFADEISASPYNGDPWAWIVACKTAGNFTGIHVGDYIPFTTTNGVTLNAQIAGINTYKNYGDSAVGSHIDFICKELWPTLHPVNPVNFNNGTATQNYPWLASDLYLYLNSLAGTAPSAAEVGGGTGTAVDYTADGVYYFLPTQLKNVIVEKKFLLPTRYSASGLLSDDNSWAWKNIGKLWLPDECEVYGMPVWGGKGGYSLGGSGLQYPLFAGNMNRLKFRNGGRDHWWLLSPYSGDSADWCRVSNDGHCSYIYTLHSAVAAPVCFRVG